jgi:predicted ester cyclase
VSTETNCELARRFVQQVLVREDPQAVDELIGNEKLAQSLKAGFAEPVDQRPFTDDRVVFDEIVANEDTVIIVAEASNLHSGAWPTLYFGVIPATGLTVSVPLILVMKIADDKIVELREYADMYHLLEQVGAFSLPAAQTEVASPVQAPA